MLLLKASRFVHHHHSSSTQSHHEQVKKASVMSSLLLISKRITNINSPGKPNARRVGIKRARMRACQQHRRKHRFMARRTQILLTADLENATSGVRDIKVNGAEHDAVSTLLRPQSPALVGQNHDHAPLDSPVSTPAYLAPPAVHPPTRFSSPLLPAPKSEPNVGESNDDSEMSDDSSPEAASVTSAAVSSNNPVRPSGTQDKHRAERSRKPALIAAG